MGVHGPIRVALIGDHDREVIAHRAIPLALALAGQAAAIDVEPSWVHTAAIPDPIGDFLAPYQAVWCVPAGPYASMTGALRAIRYARESRIPFLGTCAGFQHAVLEYVRNVLGLSDAGHAEIDPGAAELPVTPLSCSLVERAGTIELLEGSRASALVGAAEMHEEYHCSFGLNPAYEDALARHGFRVTGRDPNGEARILELEGHPFYLVTLFQAERAGLRGVAHPLVTAFVEAANPSLQRERAWTTFATPSETSSTPAR